MNLISFKKDLRKFRALQEKEDAEVKAGIKKSSNFNLLFKKYKYLFTKDNILELKDILNKVDKEEREKLHNLLFFLIENYVNKKVADLEDKITKYISKAKFRYNNRSYNYSEANLLIFKEPNKDKRFEILNSTKPILNNINKLKLKIFNKLVNEFKDLGYNYLEYYLKFKQIDYFKLEKSLKFFLKATDKSYKIRMGKFLKKHGLKIYDKAVDFAYISKLSVDNKYLPKENLFQLAYNFLNGLGINIKKQKNIILDLTERKNKTLRAWTHVLKVPSKIRVSVKPVGGFYDYRGLFHELGHAEHYANVSKDLDFEFSEFSRGYATTEIYAALFEFLISNPKFLDTYTKMDNLGKRQIIEFGYIYKFYLMRRYIGKFIYELKFFTNNLKKLDDNYNEVKEEYKDFPECYYDILRKTSLIEYQKESYLTDFDYGFYSAEYNLAWLAEIQLESYLIGRFGRYWFKNKNTLLILKNLWKYGNKLNAYEIVRLIGYNYVKVKPLIDYFNKFKLPK